MNPDDPVDIQPRPSILRADHGHYSILAINRPEQMNCLTVATMEALAGEIESLRTNNELLTLIITGAGGMFSAGADLGEISALDAATARDFSRRGQSILASLGTAAPVTIAAIDGYCLGGGLDLALSCDLRFATPGSLFQHPGASRGIITGWGGTQRLPRLIGPGAALQLFLTGDRINAGEALRIGLLNGINHDILGISCEMAERIASRFTRDKLMALKSLIY